MADSALIKALDNGSYLNCHITSAHLRRARKMYGPCHGCLLGKMTAPSQPDAHGPLSEKIAELLHVDIYYVDLQPFLISIDDMRGFITVDRLSKGKSTPMLNASLDKIINKYTSFRHTVKKIRSDREAVFLATESHLNKQGVLYEKSAPGQHVGKVERAIRTLKGRYRSVLNSLPYTLPDALQESLNLDVVQMINITPNVHTGNSNPRELTTGVKVDSSKVMRASFGDLVIAHTPNNPKNSKSKSEIGIVVGRDFTDSGTIKFWGLDTQEVVARQSFTLIPTTKDLITKINLICELEKKNKKDKATKYIDPIYMFDSNNNKTYYDLHVEDPILTIDEAIQKQNDNNQIDESFIKRVDDNVIENLDKSNSIDDVVDDSNQTNLQPVNEENQVSEQQLPNNNTMNNVTNNDKIINENVSQFEEVNKTKLKNKQIKQTKQITSAVKTVQNQNEKITQNDIKHKDSIINLDVNKKQYCRR